MSTLQLVDTFTIINPGCGCSSFAMPASIHKHWRDTHQTWHCPTCGQQRHYAGKSDAEKAREERDRAKEQLARAQNYSEILRDQRDHGRRRVTSYQGVVTRTKRRIASGVCPCCTRSFANLKRHMAGQHPDYSKSSEDTK